MEKLSEYFKGKVLILIGFGFCVGSIFFWIQQKLKQKNNIKKIKKALKAKPTRIIVGDGPEYATRMSLF